MTLCVCFHAECSVWGASPPCGEPVTAGLGAADASADVSQDAAGLPEHLGRHGPSSLTHKCHKKHLIFRATKLRKDLKQLIRSFAVYNWSFFFLNTGWMIGFFLCVGWRGSLLEGAAEDQKSSQAALRSGDHRGSGKTQPTYPPRVHREWNTLGLFVETSLVESWATLMFICFCFCF